MEPDDDKIQSFVAPSNGTEVSHYRIIEKIGASGMGDAYLAESTQLDVKQFSERYLDENTKGFNNF